MVQEPEPKRVIAFIDGQNLFYQIRNAFGYTYPNYDVQKLSAAVCAQQSWDLLRVNFYTGVPEPSDNVRWHGFWSRKLAQMGRQGVKVYSRPLKYRNRIVTDARGNQQTMLVGQEKGIDIRIALDVVKCIRQRECDVILIFSQDQDLSEVADEVRAFASEQNRWIKIASAFPLSPTSTQTRGINGSDWITFDRTLYDSCLDPRDYRR